MSPESGDKSTSEAVTNGFLGQLPAYEESPQDSKLHEDMSQSSEDSSMGETLGVTLST